MLPLTQPAPLGVARGWRLEGGDLDDPAVGQGLRDDIMDRVKANPGYQGGFIALDPARLVMHTISLWGDEAARDLSATVARRVVDALSYLTTARIVGPTSYDVLHYHQHPDSGPVVDADEVEAMRARIGIFEGADVLRPETVALMSEHLLGPAIDIPGCVTSLLLRDRTRAVLVGVTLWVDEVAAHRMVPFAREALVPILASGRIELTDSGIFPVLVYEHPPAQHPT